MTNGGDRADPSDDHGRRAGAPPLAVLLTRAPSCQVVHLVEDWERWARAEAARLAEDLRRR